MVDWLISVLTYPTMEVRFETPLNVVTESAHALGRRIVEVVDV